MNWLNKESIEAWFNLLPDDVASCMDKSEITTTNHDEIIVKDLLDLKSGSEIANYVRSKEALFIEIGRPKRIRFLAWLAGSNYPDVVRAMQMLTSQEEAGDNGGGTEKVAPLFMEDIRAFVEALGPRVAHGIVDASTLAVIKGASFEVASEIDLKSGGGL